VLAVVKDGGGTLYGLHSLGDSPRIVVSRVDGDEWTPLTELVTPGSRPRVSFARFAPSGLLWVGLTYQDGQDERPWGVAIIDVALGTVAYYHASSDRRELAQGVIPVPVGAVDAAFRDRDVWVATSEGAVRLRGADVTVWDESDGMVSELVRAIAVAGKGSVFVATGAGVGQFDGARWMFPRELAFPVNDLVLGADGRLWLATDRGVAVVWDGRVRRVDVRRGLLENRIADVALDEYGRVWARGAASLTLITP